VILKLLDVELIPSDAATLKEYVALDAIFCVVPEITPVEEFNENQLLFLFLFIFIFFYFFFLTE
jgi:hypothetical protein